jgi:DNA-binding SARP family transcriptional activator
MEVQILGRLTVNCTDVSVVPSATKERQVLALLALNANRIIPVESIRRELWRDEPPRTAPATLQTYILRLRRLFARAHGGDERTAKKVLVTHTPGYLLRLDPGASDLDRLHDLKQRGEAALLAGNEEQAARLLDEALSLWRDTPLADVRQGPLLELAVRRLEETRISTLEQRIEADLRCGRHHKVVGELAALKSEHRFNERLHAQYMLALYRSGRRHEALAAYLELREMLINDIGLEPSPQVCRLHQAILACDANLDCHAGTPGVGSPAFAMA